MPVAEPAAPAAVLPELRESRSSTSPSALPGTLSRWGLRPLTGGRNNHVCAWTDPAHGPICIKIYCKAGVRQRVGREWAALTLLAAHSVGGIPAPLWRDFRAAEPAIGMTLLPGTSLLQAGDRHDALRGLARTTARIQAVRPAGLLAGLERADSAAHYIRRLTSIWPAQLAGHPHDPLTSDMRRLLDTGHNSGDARLLLTEPTAAVLSRGDSNLLNWLRSESGTHCVDFEFSGHSTIEFDAADLIEHISSREIPDHTWAALLPELGIDCPSRPQFLAAQRTCALRWLAVLWKQRHHRTSEFQCQHARVRLLHSPGNPWNT